MARALFRRFQRSGFRSSVWRASFHAAQTALKEQLQSIALQIDAAIDRYMDTPRDTMKSQALERKLAKLNILKNHIGARIQKSTPEQRKHSHLGTLSKTRKPRPPKKATQEQPQEHRNLISLAMGITNRANRHLRSVSDGPCPENLVTAAINYRTMVNQTIATKVGPCHPLHPNHAGDTEAALSDPICNHGIEIPF